jgi:hypothetical protein
VKDQKEASRGGRRKGRRRRRRRRRKERMERTEETKSLLRSLADMYSSPALGREIHQNDSRTVMEDGSSHLGSKLVNARKMFLTRS